MKKGVDMLDEEKLKELVPDFPWKKIKNLDKKMNKLLKETNKVLSTFVVTLIKFFNEKKANKERIAIAIAITTAELIGDILILYAARLAKVCSETISTEIKETSFNKEDIEKIFYSLLFLEFFAFVEEFSGEYIDEKRYGYYT